MCNKCYKISKSKANIDHFGKENIVDIPLSPINWSDYIGPATKWINSLPTYTCETCGQIGLFEDYCSNCEEDEDDDEV